MDMELEQLENSAKIKVIGVGGAGGNAVQNMIESNLKGVTFICANTDAQALQRSSAEYKIQMGEKVTKGLGAGAKPEIGREAAQECLAAIKEAIGDADMVFITAGMGGGTGTGAAPIIAQAARELGVLTVGVVTKPFKFEGPKRNRVAEEGVAELRQHVDSLITIPNDRLLSIAPKKAKLNTMLKCADDVLYSAVRGISDLITVPGIINTDFNDVRTVMSESGLAMMGLASATGEGRAQEVARRAITSPLLEDMSIRGAKAILVNIAASEDLEFDEFNEVCQYIYEELGDVDANIIIGTAFDETAGDELRVTVIATGIEGPENRTPKKPIVNNPIRKGRETVDSTGFTFRGKDPRNSGEAQPVIDFKFEPLPEDGIPPFVDLPPFVMKPTGGVHQPGKDEFIFGDDQYDVPTFMRKQAN